MVLVIPGYVCMFVYARTWDGEGRKAECVYINYMDGWSNPRVCRSV